MRRKITEFKANHNSSRIRIDKIASTGSHNSRNPTRLSSRKVSNGICMQTHAAAASEPEAPRFELGRWRAQAADISKH